MFREAGPRSIAKRWCLACTHREDGSGRLTQTADRVRTSNLTLKKRERIAPYFPSQSPWWLEPFFFPIEEKLDGWLQEYILNEKTLLEMVRNLYRKIRIGTAIWRFANNNRTWRIRFDWIESFEREEKWGTLMHINGGTNRLSSNFWNCVPILYRKYTL